MKIFFDKIKYILKYIKPFNLLFSFVIYFVFFEVVFQLSDAILQQTIINVIDESEFTIFIRILTLSIFFIISSIFLIYIGEIFRNIYIQKLSIKMINNIFNDVNKVVYAEIEKYHTSDLMIRITQNSNSFISIIQLILFQIAGNLVLLIVSFIYLSTIQAVLAVLILLSGLISLLLGRVFDKKLKKYTKIINEMNVTIRNEMQETLKNIEIIKTYEVEEKYIQNDYERRKKLILQLNKRVFWSALLWNSLLAINDGFMIISTFFICILSLQQSVYIGALLAFINLIGRVQWPFIDVSNIIASLHQDIVSVERSMEILKAEKEIETNKQVEIKDNQYYIEFRDVDFSYKSQDTKVLKSINLKIKKGEKVGITGLSGSGKSTIAKLCCGLYTPDKGEIYILGAETKNNIQFVRHNVTYINQNPHLFIDSIYENIKIGDILCDDSDLFEAASKAHADYFITELKDGYNTKIYEDGQNFSGGQIQRISLARAFLKNAKILILDEVTSSLDLKSEFSILSQLDNYSNNDKAVIYISHKLSILKRLDKIFVINNGKIEAVGHHDDLINSCDIYKKLFLQDEHYV